MRFAIFAVLLLASALLAGCSSKGDDASPTSTSAGPSGSAQPTSGAPTSGPSGGPTTSPRPSGNQPGAGTTEVALKRLNPNGPVPLAVNLTVSATFKTPDGEAAQPSSLEWATAAVRIKDGAGTPVQFTVLEGPVGTKLPADVSLTLTDAGTYIVVAFVQAPGFNEGNASVEVLASAASGPGGPTVHFFDGAESDASQWTITSNVFVVSSNLAPGGPDEEVPREYPEAAWAQTEAEKHEGSKSWYSQYPDNYRTRMTSVPIKVPAGGASLTYWVKGGAEANGIDGLRVSVGPAGSLTEVKYHEGVIGDWTRINVKVPAGDIVLEFRFDADASCGNAGPPAAAGGSICGPGYDAGGFWVDDIKVA